MPGQRFGYPVGSHYTGVRGVRDYLRHIRSTYKLSSGWRVAAKKYASRLGKFALRGSGYIAAAAAFAEATGLAYKMYTDRRNQRGEHSRKRARSSTDPYGFHRSAALYPDAGTRANTAWNTSTQTEAMNGSAGILRAVRRKDGRRKPYASKVNKLVKTLINPQIECWRALSNGYDAANTYQLSTIQTVGSAVTCPVYLFELNNLYTEQFNGAGSRFGAGAWRIVRSVGGDFSLSPIGRQNNDNSAQTFLWDIETSNRAGLSTDGRTPFAYLDWVDIKLLINAPRKYPCVVTAQIVCFTDPAVTPGVYQTTGPTVTPTVSASRPDPAGDDLVEWNNMWLEIVTPLLSNPIANRVNQHNGRRLKVLKSMTLKLQPRDTSDDGPTNGVGDMRVVKWFYNVNRLYKYLEPAAVGGQVTNDEMTVPQETFSNVAPVYTTSAGNRARLFLLIKATTPTTASSDIASADDFASFDMNLRRKWEFLE